MPTRIPELYSGGNFGLSIEIFPPKTPQGDESLRKTLARLSSFQPGFVSCTFGAGGSTHERTLDWCAEIQKQFELTATAHFTCVGSTGEELSDWLRLAWDRGIRNIMALRGDPPQGQDEFQTVAGGFSNANQLVELIRREYPSCGIGVAGYPEKHPEAADEQTDLNYLKQKVDAGADAVFTQLFYVNENFFRFQDRCQAAGISVPIVPGIMPITSFARIKRITGMCGAVFPDGLAAKLEAVQEDDAAQFEIGVEHAVDQCRSLIDAGVPGIHFYVLNRSQACEKILESLGFEMTAADCA
ncbi:MAG: methylenetetrahydrofolate reductase [NAD(P)H] [Planctomycetes bacterium]|nr:methylenetetrahydrofolate reductase [NAD(P)H] [Planctomycetota bacterium]